MSRTIFPDIKLFTGQNANGVAPSPASVGDFRHVVAEITISSGFSAGTLQFLGSTGLQPANFGGAASASNMFSTIASKNLDTQSTIIGSTGFPLATPGVFLVEINTNGLMWLSSRISGLVGTGTVDIQVTGFNE